MSPQAKLEHIIYIVQQYEKDIRYQESVLVSQANMDALLISAELPTTSEPLRTIEPKAEVFLERIEAFLESTKSV